MASIKIYNFKKRNMQTYCTIINKSYLAFAYVLYQSLINHEPESHLQVLLIDDTMTIIPEEFAHGPEYHNINSLMQEPMTGKIKDKYAATNQNVFRWALKPVFMCYLLKKGFQKVIFTDPDMFFTGKHCFLFEELNEHAIMLSPHWGNVNPLRDEDGLFSVLRNGLYSAGFIAANQKGISTLEWWAEVCHFKMEKRQDLGLYDDQKYLNIVPLLEPTTVILRHPGCNLASINIETFKREIVETRLRINGKYEPVFIHFTRDTITNILNRNDTLLKPFLEEYASSLAKFGIELYKISGNSDFLKYDKILYKFKHRLLLRTRMKRFLYFLAEKL
ncbi:MAG: hypothetical protein J0M10_17905 [Chitinophagales bacterium]|nr:hypothetical protein [Chitinophagales bacterium]